MATLGTKDRQPRLAPYILTTRTCVLDFALGFGLLGFGLAASLFAFRLAFAGRDGGRFRAFQTLKSELKARG